jgi:hypothetical protein
MWPTAGRNQRPGTWRVVVVSTTDDAGEQSLLRKTPGVGDDEDRTSFFWAGSQVVFLLLR